MTSEYSSDPTVATRATANASQIALSPSNAAASGPLTARYTRRPIAPASGDQGEDGEEVVEDEDGLGRHVPSWLAVPTGFEPAFPA